MQRSINPFDQSILGEYSLLSEKLLINKIESAQKAFKSWKASSYGERANLFLHLADLLDQRVKDYARIITLEMGKILKESESEVKKCADGCRYFAHHAEAFLKDQLVETEASKSYICYQPTGVILAVMPWNFPLWQVFRFAAPALMAGNVGLLKHSSNTPQCSMLIEQAFSDAGFPDGVFQALIIGNEAVEKILSHDSVQGVALTGSEKAGAIVASVAGKNIKKSVLELGGSDPFIVLPDADLDLTVRIATQSRMQNAGQSCIAAKRFIVHESIKEDFIERFRIAIEAIVQGDPLLTTTTMGPMARIDLAESLESQLNKSLSQGARLITGSDRHGANFKPALIDNVVPGMTAFDEETFGPLASVTYVKSDEEAIVMANSSRYGLGASIWTRDVMKGESLARRIESGTVYINSLMRSDARLPFGGIKKSGYGRELAEAGIREFTNTKSVIISNS